MISVGTSLWQILRPSASPVPVEPAYWEMTVQTPSDGATWTINIAAGITPNITVDWGDSSSNNYNSTGVKDHVYATAGTYTVKISGSFASSGNIRLGKVGNKSYLKATLAVGGITGLINFRETFQGCTGLTSLPADLFRYNTAVSTSGFYYTFSGCSKLQQRADIFFSSGEEATRFLNRISDFQSCFNRSAFTGTQGTAPALWSCDFGTETPARTNCWDGAGNSLTSLDNYNSIPEEWK